MLKSFVNLGCERPYLTFFLIFVLTTLAASQLPKLKLKTDFSNLISKKTDLSTYNYVNETFDAKASDIIFVMDKSLFSEEKAESLRELTSALGKLPYYKSQRSLLNAENLKAVGDQIEVKPILNDDMSTNEAFAQAKEKALYNPMMVNNLVSPDGEATVIILSRADDVEPTLNKQIFQEVQAILAPFQTQFDNVFAIGNFASQHYLSKAMLHDLKTTAIIAFAVTLTLLFLLYRNFTIVIIVAITATTSIIWTFGFLGFAGIPVNILITIIPTMILVIGSTEDSHFFSAYSEILKQNLPADVRRLETTKIVIRKMVTPITLTIITTVFGFALTATSSIPLIRDFSLAAAFGFTANGLITILLAPAILRCIGPLKHHKKQLAIFRSLAIMCYRLASRKGRLLLCLTFLIAGFCLLGLTNLTINNAPAEFLRADSPYVVNTDMATNKTGNLHKINLVVDTGIYEAFKDPSYLNKLKDLQDQINEFAEVNKSESIVDLLMYTNQEMNGGDSNYYVVPSNEMLIAQYMLLFSQAETGRLANYDFSQANIIIGHSIKSTHEQEDFVLKLQEALAPMGSKDFELIYASDELNLIDSAHDLVSGQLISIAIFLLAAVIMIAVLFYSPAAGVIALVPNFLPVVILFGLMGALGYSLNVITVMVAIILVSVAIDDTIHLYYSYFKACQRFANNNTAIRHAIKEQIEPITTTSIALSVGFLSVIFSELWVSVQLGVLLAISVLLAMILDLLITPSLLVLVRVGGLWYHLPKNVLHDVRSNSPLFIGMSKLQVKNIISLCKHSKYEQGDCIISQGETSKDMFLILSGSVDVQREQDDGKSHTLASLCAGEIFGEVAFLQNVTRTASVVAKENTETIRLSYKTLKAYLRFRPILRGKLGLNVAAILAKRLQSTSARLKESHV
jgi:hypothetical protein